MKYIIGSGWWAANEIFPKERKKLGDDVIRSAEFHKLWYKSICKCTNPLKIFILESNSPIQPPLNKKDKRIEFISLDKNYGHATSCIGKYSGWMRSCLLGVAYAWMCDADYFVYVEQDVLLYGKNIIEYAISEMKHSFMFGNGSGTPQSLQQSFFIIHRSAFQIFLNNINKIKYSDKLVYPEIKFARIQLDWIPDCLTNTRMGVLWRRATRSFWYDWLPFGYGRARPINWDDPYFYFQHGSKEEVKTYMKHSGLWVDLFNDG